MSMLGIIHVAASLECVVGSSDVETPKQIFLAPAVFDLPPATYCETCASTYPSNRAKNEETRALIAYGKADFLGFHLSEVPSKIARLPASLPLS